MLCIILSVITTGSRAADRKDIAIEAIRSLQDTAPGSLIRLRRGSSFVSFLASRTDSRLPLVTPFASPGSRLRSFLQNNRNAFVDTGSDLELAVVDSAAIVGDPRGLTRVRLSQSVAGIPVRFGEVIGLVDEQGVRAVVSALVSATATVDTSPRVVADQARQVVERHLLKTLGPQALAIATASLEIIDPAVLSGRSSPPRLAWFMEVTGPVLWRHYWVDAASGELLLFLDKVAEARNRVTYDARNTTNIPGTPVRIESTPASGIADVDQAHDYAADFYDYFMSQHGRDSWDGRGAQIVSVARLCDPAFGCPMQNAFWNGSRVAYGQGFAIDDIVAHELTHGVIQTTADLVYQNEPGALNESFSDIFGEAVDLQNGRGQDGASDRWLVGEQLSGRTAIRDMMNPSRFGDPEKVTDNSYVCGTQDNGGVHTNSGVPNHAFALMVDGGSYNGYTITGIGLVKAGMIQYRALASYLTATSDFQTNYDALLQSCNDLIGSAGITFADCAEVKNALLAVEMTTTPCSAALPPPLPPAAPSPTPPASTELCSNGGSAQILFSEDFESTTSGRWQNSTLSGVNHWNGGSGSPPVYHSSGPYSGSYSLRGSGRQGVGDSVVTMSSAIAVGSAAWMQFVSDFNFETGYDGGVLEYSTNNGGTWRDAANLIASGRNYTGGIVPGSDNPLAGRLAFTGSSGGYVPTRLSLASLAGQTVRFRFRVGTDLQVASPGWFVDDMQIYECNSNTPPVATSRNLSVNEDQGLALSLSASDADGDVLSYRVTRLPANGSLSGSPPSLVYQPSRNFSGQDSFSFVASDGQADSNSADIVIQVVPVNDPPVANSRSVSLLEDTTTNISLTGSDADGDSLSWRISSAPGFGTATLSGAVVSYRPNGNFFGQDSFRVVASDGVLDSQAAIITLNVAAVNDRPVASAQSVTASAGQTFTGTLQGTDADGDVLSYRIVASPAGTLSGSLPAFFYTPPAGFTGSDSFSFVVNDGVIDSLQATVSIQVGAGSNNRPPQAFNQNVSLNEDSSASLTLSGFDPDGDALQYTLVSSPVNGTVTGSGDRLTYTPYPNFYGSDSLSFRVSDGQLSSATATVSISVNGVNDRPTAQNLFISTSEGDAVPVSLSGTDVEGDALFYSIYQAPSSGVLQGSGRNMVYYPNNGFVGSDSFLYTVSDGNSSSTAATVNISVTASPGGGPTAPAVIITPDSGLYTSEAGATAEFTVVLASAPSAPVTMNLYSSDLSEGRVLQSSLIFTASNWSQPRRVEIAGVADSLADGDVAYWLVTEPLISADPAWHGLNPSDIMVINREAQSSLVNVSPLNGLATTEYGGVARFSVSIGEQPEAGIILYFSVSDSSEGRIVPQSISFTRNNWRQPQVISVTGLDDEVQDGDVHFSVITMPAISLDPRFDGIDPPDVLVTNSDNDSTQAAAGVVNPLFWGLFLLLMRSGVFFWRKHWQNFSYRPDLH